MKIIKPPPVEPPPAPIAAPVTVPVVGKKAGNYSVVSFLLICFGGLMKAFVKIRLSFVETQHRFDYWELINS